MTIIVGMGEHCHGDHAAWKWRIRIAKAIAKAGHKLVILTEAMDFYVKEAREPRIVFETYVDVDPKSGRPMYYPYMVPYSNFTTEHLHAVVALADIADRRVFGVDAQVLKFPDVLKRSGDYVRGRLTHLRKTHPKLMKRYKQDAGTTVRNEIQGRLVSLIASDYPDHVVLYFAHNHHVACSSDRTRESFSYHTDAYWISCLGGHVYRSIGTCSPGMWDFQHDAYIRSSATVEEPAKILRGDFLLSDFDYVIAQEADPGTPESADISRVQRFKPRFRKHVAYDRLSKRTSVSKLVSGVLNQDPPLSRTSRVPRSARTCA